MRPLIVLCAVSLVLCFFYMREGDAGLIHSVRSVTNTIASPVRYLGSAVATPFNAVGNVVENLATPQESYDELKKKNDELTTKVAELQEQANTAERLQGLLDIQSTYNLQSTAARIIGTSSDAWTSTVTIDKGSKDGIELNMPVSGSSGVIGQVIEVSLNTSTVRLITDENSGVSAMVQDTRAQGMVKGQPDGTLLLEYVTTDSDVKEGDIVVTSGIGGVYPKGLPIGTVQSVSAEANAVYYTIVLKAQANMENNEEVLVITSLIDEQAATNEEVSSANATPQGGARSSESGDKSGSEGSSDASSGDETGSSDASDEYTDSASTGEGE